jgi:hypothetical protein
MDVRHSKFDFFIAHAGPDAKAATALYRLLSKTHRVFLDAKSLMPGDPWDEVLPKAQQQSRITVVLISPHTDFAYYQREEIAQAIALSRSEAGRHHVIPIFLGSPPAPPNTPYGLRRLNFLFIEKDNAFHKATQQLVETFRELLRRLSHQITKEEATITFESPYEGNGQLTLYPGDTIMLGRMPDTGLVFDHPRVSRQHAQLRLSDKGLGLSVTDLGSTNHTYVNGVIAYHTVLRTGDILQLSKFGPVVRIVRAPLPVPATEPDSAV